MKRLIVSTLFLSVFFQNGLIAQTLLRVDRLTNAYSAYTLPKLKQQVEAGLGFGSYAIIPEAVVRYGLMDDLEVRAEIAIYYQSNQTNLNGLKIGSKLKLPSSWLNNTRNAFVGNLILPLKLNHRLGLEFQYIGYKYMSKIYGFSYQLGYNTSLDRGNLTLNLPVDFHINNDRWMFSIEPYAWLIGVNSFNLKLGASYLIENNLQIDASIDQGLVNSKLYIIRVGGAYRF